MSNPFFVNTIDLLPATKARAGDVESNFTAVEAGFDEAKQYFDRTLRGARANPVIAEIPDAATRAGKALTFDGSGNPAATVSTTEISNAQANAVAAAASAVAADASATAAAGSASSAAASLDSFDDRYLGSKASDPSVDNDGNALLVGALYWNSALGDMRVWNGSAWATFSNFVAKAGDTMTGPLNFSGTGLRLTGDFSNATVANRLMFQTSAVNGGSVVGVLPNGTAGSGHFRAYGNSDPTNASFVSISSNGVVDARVNSDREGSGSYLPMTFYTGGSERLRIDTSGNINIPTLGARITGDFSNLTIANRLAFQTNVLNDNTNLSVLPNGTGTTAGVRLENSSAALNNSVGLCQLTATDFRLHSLVSGSGAQLPITFLINNVEAFRVDTSRNVLVTGSGGLGYGVGSGGTVTQATSKSTTVTLNKPSGTITMNNATLNAGATVSFGFSNSSIGFQDIVDLQVVGGAATRGTYEVWADQSGFGAGSVAVFVKNISAGNLSEAVVLSFAVKKVATS